MVVHDKCSLESASSSSVQHVGLRFSFKVIKWATVAEI